MRKAIVALACLMLTAQTPAAETVPAELPSETAKARALTLGYWLNGNSMVRDPKLGSIDVSLIVDFFPNLSRESTLNGSASQKRASPKSR